MSISLFFTPVVFAFVVWLIICKRSTAPTLSSFEAHRYLLLYHRNLKISALSWEATDTGCSGSPTTGHDLDKNSMLAQGLSNSPQL
ncbi:hypothetical protein GJ744_006845 [Endocarpon pusillum]|uniref:Uncharacterized protein n=1 Tax=Endocarpon pusillum TaxID=364733 RepID=A0A8H7AMY0_9EURO|nr:hypothetical protein GJ744_006845 [Endocarpon pusillum]